MIARLTGTISTIEGNQLILDVGGVGYEITVTSRTRVKLTVNSQVSLFIAENIKEDHYELYGFVDASDRAMYQRLNAVSGVGPKATMAILAAHTPTEIEAAILSSDTTIFSNVSGIGKKTASRIILELKGKLEISPATNKDDPAYQALLTLGYSARQADSALMHVPTELELDDRVRAALKGLAK